MMPALGKGGPRPGCLRGAFSSGRTGWLGRESGCGGGTRGGEKVLPPGLEGVRVSTAGAGPLRGGSTAEAVDGFSPLLAPTSYCGCLVGKRAQAPSSWCGRSGLEAPGPGGGGEGVRCWPTLPLGPLPGVADAWKLARGCLFLSPGGPPTSCVLSPPGTLGRGLEGCATRCPGPILLKPLLPWRAGGRGGSRERSFSPPQGRPFRWWRQVCTPEGAAAATASRTHESRGEERTHAGSRRPLAWPAPGPPRLAALTLAAGRLLGASARVASLPARARPECGVVIVTLRSGGASRRSCSGCGSRCPRLGRAGCRPGGALTSPPCSAPVPPPPFTLPLSVEPTCCSGKAHARQNAQIPPSRPLLRASALPSPSPCVYNS